MVMQIEIMEYLMYIFWQRLSNNMLVYFPYYISIMLHDFGCLSEKVMILMGQFLYGFTFDIFIKSKHQTKV